MGQDNCCAGKTQKLLQNYDNQILNFIIGVEGTKKAKGFFNQFKESVTTKFNKMPFSPLKQKDYMKALQKIDNDQKSEINKFQKLKTPLTEIPVFNKMSGLDMDNLMKYARQKFGTQISDRLKNYEQGAKNMFSIDKYMNVIK